MTEQTQSAYMFPTSVKEVERLGWDYIDIILFQAMHSSTIRLPVLR